MEFVVFFELLAGHAEPSATPASEGFATIEISSMLLKGSNEIDWVLE